MDKANKAIQAAVAAHQAQLDAAQEQLADSQSELGAARVREAEALTELREWKSQS